MEATLKEEKNLKVLIKVTVGAGESEEGTKKPEAEEGWRCSSERGSELGEQPSLWRVALC